MRKPTEEELKNYREDTIDHINKVRNNLDLIIGELYGRGKDHDLSKFMSEEQDIYAVVVPKLQGLEYGTPEYKEATDKLGPAWEHHLEHNDHHSRHHENGIYDMDLMMIIEMLCDWKAANDRNPNNNFEEGLLINLGKYEIEDQLASVILHTAKNLGWI